MAYRAAGLAIPRTAAEQWDYGRRIPASRVQPGDLVFFAGADGTWFSGGRLRGMASLAAFPQLSG
jgi:cell wall-associated NlpC family hydrolase